MIPTYRNFPAPLQQSTFKNIVAKGETTHDEQFLFNKLLSYIYIYIDFLYVCLDPLMSSAADLQFIGKAGTVTALENVKSYMKFRQR